MTPSRFVPRVTRDGKLVFAASAVRALDYSFLSVFLGVYLSLLDFSVFQAGIVFSGVMAGGMLSNVIASWKGDAIGRRRMLIAMSVLMVIGGVLFAFVTGVASLAIVGLFAMTTTTGDRTAFVSLDTAILAQTTSPAQRTLVFSWYNLVGFVTRAVGTLLIVVPGLLQSRLGMAELPSYQTMFGVYAAVAVGGILFYAMLSPRSELIRTPQEAAPDAVSGISARSAILRIAGLFSMDSLGGGFFVRSFISFWFVTRFGVGLETIALIFFFGQVANVLSVMLAAPVAARIGLINTMVFTQALSNTFTIALALSGNVWMALAFFLMKEVVNEMDVPTRQSYTMAIVPPDSRMAMAGVTNLGRNITQTISPGLAGYVAQVTFLGAPFLIGAGIKLIYNAALYLQFRAIKAPEEERQQPARSEPQGREGGS